MLELDSGTSRPFGVGESVGAPRADALAAWCVVEPVLDDAIPVAEYEAGSWGPPQADALIAPYGRWRAPAPDV